MARRGAAALAVWEQYSQMTTNGTLATLVSFAVTNAYSPYAGLTLGSDGNFYGTTWAGGTQGVGTVFRISTNGALTSLHSFTGGDGANPNAELVQGSERQFLWHDVARRALTTLALSSKSAPMGC